MKKRLGLTTLALGTALAILAPATAMARDRDDHRGDRDGWRGGERHEYVRRDRDWGRDRYYRAPAPVIVTPPANGYYDQYGVWHPYAPQYYGY